MATQNHDWVSLVGMSGLVASEPVLADVFPDGPTPLDQRAQRRFRAEWNRWLASDKAEDNRPLYRWVGFILEELLGHGHFAFHKYPAIDERMIVELLEYQQKLWPDRVLPGEDGKAQMLVRIVPRGQALDRRETETGRWRASPFTKLVRLLRETEVPLGLLTNGDEWRLVYAEAGLPTAYLEWTAQSWNDERATLNAFVMLAGVERFDPELAEANLLALVHQSQDRQVDVADQLGEQVRAALWVFVHALDEADRKAGGDILAGMTTADIYEMAIILMMRLLFLLYAEEHRLLPHGEVLYDQGYGVTYLWTRLQRQQREYPETLNDTYDAWLQLLATFHMVHDGVAHPDFNLLAYGGSLFDPDRFPALRDPRMLIPNQVMGHIMERILLARSRLGGEWVVQRVSYRALDVEQFGYMYEGLLDHVVRRADAPTLALRGTKHKQPEILLNELEARWDDEEVLIEYLHEETGRSKSALANALAAEPDEGTRDALGTACGADEALFQRVLPYANLLQDLEYGTGVIQAGGLYVTEGPTRRATGTHYTPVTLTVPIVQHTLEPLVYHGPAEGLPREEWTLRPAPELLDLKVCDMAMGSGAFLVQVCRYLAERLEEAWAIAEHAGGGETRVTPLGEPPSGGPGEMIVPTDNDERVTLARRLVADRCIYGVDKNPLAVEMAKLSLWLITLDRHKPFTFLDHALKAGDSLVGVSLEQLAYWNLDTSGTRRLETERIRLSIDEVIEMRREIAELPVLTIEDQQRKEWLHAQAEARIHNLKQGADMLVGSYFNDLSASEQEYVREQLLLAFREGADVPPDVAVATGLGELPPFHWQLEYPEVFLNDHEGFDAYVGNPPFLGGSRISIAIGNLYYQYLRQAYPTAYGQTDLCALFFLRGFENLTLEGTVGLIATKTIAEGDTRRAGLEYLLDTGATIYRARSSSLWPGISAVAVTIVHLYKGNYGGAITLDETSVPRITPFLDSLSKVGEPYKLLQNVGISFNGTKVYGSGFVLQVDEAQALIGKGAANREVLFPYLGARDFNSRPDQSPTRWVINFYDWTLDRAEAYPDCLAIVEEKVKPERQKVKRKNPREKWWLYEHLRPELYRTIRPLEQVLVCPRVTKYVNFGFVANGMVYGDSLYVFSFEGFSSFAIVQCSLHQGWVRKYSSSLETRLRYTATDVFENFPLPEGLSALEETGKAYHEDRREVMLDRWEGLTDIYNRFHDPVEAAEDINHLRKLHVEMDHAVATAYGWDDLDLGHSFHETRQGLRYTISEAARREGITRLLQLNHERYEEEVRQGLHDEKTSKGKRKGGNQEDDGGQLELL